MSSANIVQVMLDVHQSQQNFLDSEKPYRGFVGGRGAGKSFIGALDLMCRAVPNRLFMVVAPTYPMLRDSSLRSFVDIAQKHDYLRDLSKGDMRATLGNGAEILFRSADDPERLRGPNLSGAWIDEASLVHRDAFDIVIACLRECGEQGWLSCTFTPKGRSHWTYEVFGKENEKAELFHASTRDNPFLPETFADTLQSQYTSAFAAQEIDGQFVDLGGTVARREWFTIVDAAPVKARRVRAWDFASSIKTSADYTVGTLMSVVDGIYTVENVVRAQTGPAGVESLVKQTARMDGVAVEIALEQEPGSSGDMATHALIRALSGYNARAYRPSVDKITRAMPFLAQAQAGNVRVVRAPWNSLWLDEFSLFPSGAHDDQVDSCSNAFARLTSGTAALVVM